jgi:pimeloyl-ACP methyl ester carboxylesterase
LSSHVQTAAELRGIGAATLVLVGENELPAFRRCAELIRRAIPDCQRVYLPDVGHLCILEDPERAHAAIDVHLRTHGTPAPVAGTDAN